MVSLTPDLKTIFHGQPTAGTYGKDLQRRP